MQNHRVRVPLMKRLLGQNQQHVHSADLAGWVAESLNYLLNVRRGMVVSELEYGLPDVSVLTHTPLQLLHVLERCIFELLQRYEPRLKQLRVHGALDTEFPERIFFSIQAYLIQSQDSSKVNYQSMLLPGGRVMIKAT